MNVLGPALRGAVAGCVGTLAMDLLWYSRHRSGGGAGPFREWEVTRDVRSWTEAPAPGRMGRKVITTVTGRDVPVERAAALSNLMHWAYGVSWTIAYGTLVHRRGGRRPVWHGPAFGAVICLSDYVVLPPAGIYEPIWEYDVSTLYKDLSAHVLFGAVADGALRLMP